MSTAGKRLVVFQTDEGMVAVNPDHVCLVEPDGATAMIHLVAPGLLGAGLTRRVNESFDEVVRSLRAEDRPRPVR